MTARAPRRERPGARGPAGRFACLVLTAYCLLFTAARPAGADYPYGKMRPERLKYAPLQFSPPEPVKKTLPNGMTLYLLEDHELPLFNAVAYIKVGSIYEPADKVGLAALTGTVMRTGGTDERTGDVIDETLEFVGGSVETEIGAEYGTASVSTLQKDASTGLEILAAILRRPAFREEKLELAKQQTVEVIRRKNDQPAAIADRVFAQALYGEESPWAREPTIASIRGITRADLQAFHARFFAPTNVILAAAGDLSTDELTRLIERWFGDWERKPVTLPAVAPVPEAVTPGVILVPKEAAQANIRMGHLGIRRHSPDHYAVRVMNYILGLGGFSSRLMREVRNNRGLAYSVWGWLGEGLDRGAFQMQAETKVESTHAAITAMRETMEGMVRDPVGAQELALAREALLNSIVFRYDSRFRIASDRAYYDLLGYPPDYLATLAERIAAVKPEDVQRVAREYLHPERMVTVVVAPPKKLGQPLDDLGPVQIKPLQPPE